MSISGKSSTSAKKSNDVTKADSSSTANQAGKTVEKTVLDKNAIDKIVQDTLGGAGGIKDIFGQEQATGIYDSTVANAQSGNFAAQLVGELAKLTSERVTTTEDKKNMDTTALTKKKGEEYTASAEVDGSYTFM